MQRQRDVCIYVRVYHLQASTIFYRITIMHSQLQLLQICKVNIFVAFPTTETREGQKKHVMCSMSVLTCM